MGIKNSLMFSLLVSTYLATSQPIPLTLEEDYDFVRYDLNKLDFYGDSLKFHSFYSSLEKLMFKGEGHISILHLGSSHIQADIFSGQIRKNLQTMAPGLKASRGFLFPYRIAKTNNPYNFGVSYRGKWESCKSTNGKDCQLGLSGYSVTTTDPRTSIKIFASRAYYMGYDFNKVRIFHKIDSTSYSIRLDQPDSTYSIQSNADLGYTEIQLAEPIDTLRLSILKQNEWQTGFQLYGITLETDDPGITYHAVGVNGADLEAFLDCELLIKHTRALAPNLVILSIGINDAHTRYFKPEIFIDQYQELINRIKEAAPTSNLILTTNNDSYYRRRYPNKNAEAVRNAMIKLAKRNHAAVWDLYEIMGGFNSVQSCQAYGLAQPDKIHFTRQGYLLLGNLLFKAIINPFEKHLQKP